MRILPYSISKKVNYYSSKALGEYKGCLVLNYHGLVENYTEPVLERNFHLYKDFEDHIRYVLKSRDIISVEELHHRIINKKDISTNAVITFDDGYKNNMVIPEILNKIRKSIPFTIFASTGLIDNEVESIWTVNVSLLMIKGDIPKITCFGKQYDLSNLFNKRAAFAEIRNTLKKIGTIEKNKAYNHILSQYSNGFLEELLSLYPQFKILNWAECKELQNNSGSIESHGFKNEILNNKQDVALIREEVIKSRDIIRDKLQHKVISFAYPNGDYCDETINALKENGYLIAFTTKNGLVNHSDNLFLLNRVTPSAQLKKFSYQF